jgi:hypothetical protein
VDEAQIAADLRLSQKNVRKALRYLEAERLLSAETVKFTFKRKNDEVGGGEGEGWGWKHSWLCTRVVVNGWRWCKCEVGGGAGCVCQQNEMR